MNHEEFKEFAKGAMNNAEHIDFDAVADEYANQAREWIKIGETGPVMIPLIEGARVIPYSHK